MNIYTFYHKIHESVHNDQIKLIDLWTKSWSYYGWNPIVLTMNDVKSHQQYKRFDSVCRSFPTVNAVEFEVMCYLRWLPMSLLGGWFTDYDVINYGFEPTDLGDKIVTTTNQIGGSTVFGTVNFYERVIDTILNYKISKTDVITLHGKTSPHISDLYLLSKTIRPDIMLNIEKCYGIDGYETSPLVHYGNAYIKRPDNRIDVIKKDSRFSKFL